MLNEVAICLQHKMLDEVAMRFGEVGYKLVVKIISKKLAIMSIHSGLSFTNYIWPLKQSLSASRSYSTLFMPPTWGFSTPIMSRLWNSPYYCFKVPCDLIHANNVSPLKQSLILFPGPAPTDGSTCFGFFNIILALRWVLTQASIQWHSKSEVLGTIKYSQHLYEFSSPFYS